MKINHVLNKTVKITAKKEINVIGTRYPGHKCVIFQPSIPIGTT